MYELKKLHCAITLALGGFSVSAQASLTSSVTLSFDAGTPLVTSCLEPAIYTGSSCTLGGTTYTAFEITDMGGSYFKIDTGNGNTDKIAISQFTALHFGDTQLSSGQHTGKIDGSESPAIDNPWNFFMQTGMHTNTSPIVDLTGSGSIRSINMSGWGLNWADFGPGGLSGPTVSLAGIATLVCSTASCSSTSTYTLDMADVHVPIAFPSAPYSLHLEGNISNPVPVPAAAWLFGSGLAGLASITRRIRHKK